MPEIPVGGITIKKLSQVCCNQDNVVQLRKTCTGAIVVKYPVRSKWFPATPLGLDNCQQAALLLKRQYELMRAYLPEAIPPSLFSIIEIRTIRHTYYGVLTVQEYVKGKPAASFKQIPPPVYDHWNTLIYPGLIQMLQETEFPFFFTLGKRVLANAKRAKPAPFPGKTPNLIITPDERIKIIDFGFPKTFILSSPSR